MLAKVKAWTPPTPDHEGLKNYMVEQLAISMLSGPYDAPVQKEPEEWLAAQIKTAERDIDYYTKNEAEEQARAEERTRWIQQLKASL